jgi:NTP pyrophosphatase (non-canonical NTP hydrolase)
MRLFPKKETVLEQIEKLYTICNALDNRFPGNQDPFRILARLLEESGETASAVHHIEKIGRKVEKHGDPDKEDLVKEIFDVITSILSLARYYEVEEQLKDKIEKHYQMVIDENLI